MKQLLVQLTRKRQQIMRSSTGCTTVSLRRSVNYVSAICGAHYSRLNTPMLKETKSGLNMHSESSVNN